MLMEMVLGGEKLMVQEIKEIIAEQLPLNRQEDE